MRRLALLGACAVLAAGCGYEAPDLFQVTRSGADRNASITYKLFEGRTYVARLRLFYPGASGNTSLMYS